MTSFKKYVEFFFFFLILSLVVLTVRVATFSLPYCGTYCTYSIRGMPASGGYGSNVEYKFCHSSGLAVVYI